MLRLTVFEITAVKWQKNRYLRGQKWSTRTPFLTPHLQTPKVIAIKMGEHLSGTWLYHHVDWRHARRDICHRTKKETTDLISTIRCTSVFVYVTRVVAYTTWNQCTAFELCRFFCSRAMNPNVTCR